MNSWEVVDIDHYMIRVADLQSSVAAYESFGFTVAPERQNVGMGALTGEGKQEPAKPAPEQKKAPFNNRLIMFEGPPGQQDVANFLELMCMQIQFGLPVEITKMMSFMWDTEGPKAIITYTNNLDRTVELMIENGVETNRLKAHFKTGWFDGDTFIPIEAEPCVPVFRQTPFMINAYETTTLDSFRYPKWTVHANTAKYMSGITGITDDIRNHAETMAGIFGVEPKWESDDVAVISPRGTVSLRVVTPAGFAELYPGLDYSTERVLPALSGATVAVESLDTLRSVLKSNGVKHVETPRGAVVVPRQLACNTVLEFVSTGA